TLSSTIKQMETIEQMLNIKVSYLDEETMKNYDIEQYRNSPVIDASTSIDKTLTSYALNTAYNTEVDKALKNLSQF
ncbi:17120_t:CDS:2, partial [Funneliformis caledonium]